MMSYGEQQCTFSAADIHLKSTPAAILTSCLSD